MSPGHPAPPIDQAYAPESYYPASNNFPPPPGGQYSPQGAFIPPEHAQAPPGANHQEFYQPPQGYTPPHNVYSPPPVGAFAPAGGRRADENVSPGFAPNARSAEEGVFVPFTGATVPYD